MKSIILALVAAALACAQEAPLRLYCNGIGPIAVSSYLTADGKWTATIRNESGVALRQACLCIRPSRLKAGCDVILKCTSDHIESGQSVSFREEVPARGHGLPKHQVILLNVHQTSRLDGIRKVFVESLPGGNGELAREQIMAAIANSERFELTEDSKTADAVLRGRAETRNAGERYMEGTRTQGAAIALPGRMPVAAGGVKSSTSGETRVIAQDLLVLRLVAPSGDTLWAWDDSGSCGESLPKAKCAVANLVEQALK